MKFGELVKRQDAFLFFMIFLASVGLMAALFTIAKSSDEVANDLLDLAAYAFPILAGVAAGGGIYYKDDPEVFFGASCFLLVAGLTSYMELKGISGAVICAALGALLVWLISSAWLNVDEAQRRHSPLLFLRWVAVRAVLAAVLLALMWLLIHDALINGVQKGGGNNNAQQHGGENAPHHD